MTKSNSFKDAEIFYNDNKENLLAIMHKEFVGKIDYQSDYDQIAVWFDEFSLCYQNSDMNGGNLGGVNFDNPGANSGLQELESILEKDSRFDALIASDEYHSHECLRELITDFCYDYAEKHNITDYLDDKNGE